MTFTAAYPDQVSIGANDNSHRDRKLNGPRVDPKHFLTLLRSQTALIRETVLPEWIGSEPCDLSAFGPGSAVTVRKIIPITSRTSALVGSCRRLVTSFEAFVSQSGSAVHLAEAIFDFCHTLRMCRFSAPEVLKLIIDHEAESGVLLPFTNALKALVPNNQSQLLYCIEQLRSSNLFQDTVSLSMFEITCNKVRRNLHALQKLVAACQNHNNSGGFQSSIPVSSAMLLLIETTTQIVGWLHKFLCHSYVADEYEEVLMSNLYLLSESVVTAAQKLVTSAVKDFRIALSRFWVSVKALIDILAGDEQFGDEPLQGTHTGRQLLFHYMKKMQSARDKIRKYLD